MNLVPEKLRVDDGAAVVPATGVGSIVLDRANVLQYRCVFCIREGRKCFI